MTTETTKQFWMRSETLSDYAVIETVTQRGGKVLQMRNSNYKLELTASAATEISARYGWELNEVVARRSR